MLYCRKALLALVSLAALPGAAVAQSLYSAQNGQPIPGLSPSISQEPVSWDDAFFDARIGNLYTFQGQRISVGSSPTRRSREVLVLVAPSSLGALRVHVSDENTAKLCRPSYLFEYSFGIMARAGKKEFKHDANVAHLEPAISVCRFASAIQRVTANYRYAVSLRELCAIGYATCREAFDRFDMIEKEIGSDEYRLESAELTALGGSSSIVSSEQVSGAMSLILQYGLDYLIEGANKSPPMPESVVKRLLSFIEQHPKSTADQKSIARSRLGRTAQQ
jgi:hypothetical protein